MNRNHGGMPTRNSRVYLGACKSHLWHMFFPSQPSPKLLPPTFNKDLIENPVLAKFVQCA